MANIIKPKRSSVPAKVPTTSDIVSGEIAINNYDCKIYQNNGTSVVQVGAGKLAALSDVTLTSPTNGQSLAYNGTAWVNSSAGTGDVVGAASSTDNAIVRFNGTTGKVIQNSNATIDDNGNLTANSIFDGFSSVAASGTQITLTTASVPNYVITGSGGQIIQLPNATTLPSGASFSFNNNQSSGAITVNNNSGTLIVSIPSGGYTIVSLLSNASAAGSWDVHDQAPSNVSWSTNTFSYAGSFTNGTWNGNVVTYNRGGTGQSSAFVAGGVVYGSTTSALAVTPIGTSGQVLTSQGAGIPTWTTPTTGTVTSVAMTVPTGLSISGTPITTSGTLALTFTSGYSIPTTASQTNWDTAYTDRLKWDGGSTGLVAATGRTSLGGTTVGQNFFTLTNPSAITFPRINADNTVSALARQDAMDVLAGAVTSGQYLRGNGTDVVMSAIQAADVPTLNQSTTGNAATATTATNVTGSITTAISTKTTAYTATASDNTLLGNATSAAFSITLPTAVGITGKTYTVKKIDSSANAVTVATTSSQTIDGTTTKPLARQYDAIAVQSDGSNWMIINQVFGRNGTTGSF